MILIYLTFGCTLKQVFAFIQKISVSFRLVRRFIQGLALLVSLAGIIVAVVLTELSVTDIFACVLAFLPTGWGVLSVSFLLSHLVTFSFQSLGVQFNNVLSLVVDCVCLEANH